MYEYLTGVEMACLSKPVKRRIQRATHALRWLNAVPIRDGEGALMVNWLELTIRNAKGEITYRNSFVNDLPIDPSRVEGMADAGRARWKIENETFNVLKTKGYNLEHNFGHGKSHPSSILASLNLLAFAIHAAAELADEAWKARPQNLRRAKPLLQSPAIPHRLHPLPILGRPLQNPRFPTNPAPAAMIHAKLRTAAAVAEALTPGRGASKAGRV
jgi:hypothetical protein